MKKAKTTAYYFFIKKMFNRKHRGHVKTIGKMVLLLLTILICSKAENVQAAENATVYVVPAITDNKILPTSSISSSYISDTISIKASPGEYEPASFVVHADQNINSMSVVSTNLTGSAGTIPSASVDIKTVKCWYQGGYYPDSRAYFAGGRYLTPELLLKDDALIQTTGEDWNQWNVSNPDGENHLKLTDGFYVDISKSSPQHSDRLIIPISECPVSDASTLQPVSIPNGYNKQFWITLNVPKNATAGDYSGTITLQTIAGTVRQLQLNVRVLPIILPDSNIEHSLYYRGYITNQGSISSEEKTTAQFTAEINDMVSHGVINPTVYGTDSHLAQALPIRVQAGMNNPSLYYLGVGFSSLDSIPYYKSISAPYGITDVYIYGADEQDMDTPQTRAEIATVHNVGGKVMNAQSVGLASTISDVLDLAVTAGAPSVSLAASYHSYGHKVYSYANPQTIPECPGVFRMNYGLLLWQKDYDGAMDYAYQDGDDIWNDFDADSGYRNHVLAYPTMNGVIDTVQWEGFREGVDDLRYLAALQNTIASAKSQGKNTSEAEDWLANLKNSNLNSQDPDAVRSQMIDYILKDYTSRTLTVANGTGSGSYTQGASIAITANPPAAGKIFDRWTGDTSYVADVTSSSVIVTMPNRAISLIATYKDASNSWYSMAWSYRKLITINHSKVSHIIDVNQTNFPVLVSVTDDALKTTAHDGKVANINGYDIIFTNKTGDTQLAHEVESYDETTGTIVMWVKIPILSHSTDTVIYVYYGNSDITTTQEHINSVWNDGGTDNFKGVWHMNGIATGNAGDYIDSTVNANNSTNTDNQPVSTASGQIDGAQSFDGTSADQMSMGSGSSLDMDVNNFTVEAWVNAIDAYGTNQFVGKMNAQTADKSGFILGGIYNGLIFRVRQPDGTWSNNIEAFDLGIVSGTWNHLVGVRNATNIIVYVNGVQRGSAASTGLDISNSQPLRIGGGCGDEGNGYPRLNGTIDEVRISNTARSADWIKTEYDNQSDPGTFIVSAGEEHYQAQTAFYALTINQGTGSGSYFQGQNITITANTPQTGQVFDKWTGDISYIANITSSPTTVTMPANAVSMTATYKNSSSAGSGTTGSSSNSIPIITKVEITKTEGNILTLSLNVTDATSMMLSESSSFLGSVWETYSLTKTYTKQSTQTKLYLKFKSSTDTISSTVELSIPTNTTTTTPDTLNLYPTGTLLKLSDSPKVYAIIDNKKKWIPTPEVFEQLGYKWTEIKVITESQLNQFPDYEDNLIRQQGDYKVYLVVNGVKRHIPNPIIFLDYGFKWNEVKDVSKETIDKYKNTYLIKQSGSNGIYYVNPQEIRKLIPNTEVFNSYNDKQEDVQIISKTEMDFYLLSNLIKLNGSNDIYLIEGNIKRRIPNPTIFNKYKLNWNYVMSVNQTEFNFYQDGGELK